MHRPVLRFVFLCAVASVVGVSCDWNQLAFLNSIPFRTPKTYNPAVHVVIAVDGLSPYAVEEAMRRGAFGSGQSGPMKLSQVVTPFPGTSGYSWSRTLRSERLEGYEIEFYSPELDRVENTGIIGLAKHVMPVIAEDLNFREDYLTKAFDYFATGYSQQAKTYQETFSSFPNSMNSFFYLLEGRAQTSPLFFGYFAEIDVMGHMYSFEDIVRSLQLLSKKIDQFRANHHDREYRFTLISDHGNDFLPVESSRLVSYQELMPAVGVTPVRTLAGLDPTRDVYAIAIEHVRVTYLAMHTHSTLREEVALRVSRIASTDFAVTRLLAAPAGAPAGSEWYGIYADGVLVISFGFDSSTDTYWIPSTAQLTRAGITPLDSSRFNAEGFASLTDEEAFEMTRLGVYPDLFYRVRTSLSTTYSVYPADVLVSLKREYVESGFELPGGANAIAVQGFHGSLDVLGSMGTLLSEDTGFPSVVRSDNLLELLPDLKDHLKVNVGEGMIDPDANASLDYSRF